MSDEKDPASPICFLSEAPDSYALARSLMQGEIVALLDRLLECVRAGNQAEAENRIRESLPLIADEALRGALAAMVDAHHVALADVLQLRRDVTIG